MSAWFLRSGVVARQEGNPAKAMESAAQKVEAVYEVPFLAHATMEPVNCTVHDRPDGCDIWVGRTSSRRLVAALRHGSSSK
jgi:isoquinoline 1-oxidoreductase beta subunit